jgi:hypothetical protein
MRLRRQASSACGAATQRNSAIHCRDDATSCCAPRATPGWPATLLKSQMVIQQHASTLQVPRPPRSGVLLMGLVGICAGPVGTESGAVPLVRSTRARGDDPHSTAWWYEQCWPAATATVRSSGRWSRPATARTPEADRNGQQVRAMQPTGRLPAHSASAPNSQTERLVPAVRGLLSRGARQGAATPVSHPRVEAETAKRVAVAALSVPDGTPGLR